MSKWKVKNTLQSLQRLSGKQYETVKEKHQVGDI